MGWVLHNSAEHVVAFGPRAIHGPGYQQRRPPLPSDLRYMANPIAYIYRDNAH